MDLKEYIDFTDFRNADILYYHLLIEEYYNAIDESLGIPDGLRNDASYISSLIMKNTKSHNRNITNSLSFDVDISKLNMDIEISSLKINVDYNDENLYDGDTNLKTNYTTDFTIVIRCPHKPSISDITGFVAHELLHIFIYVKNHELKGKSIFLKRLDDYGYNKLFKSTLPNEDIADNIIYYTNEDEVNAFITQTTLEIEMQKPRNSEEAYKILYNNELYKNYVMLKEWFKKSKRPEYDDIFNILRNTKKIELFISKSNHEIIRMIRDRFYKIEKRFTKIIPRIFKKNLNHTLTVDKNGGVIPIKKLVERLYSC